jgi:DNA-directed RNA polymerase specialized sigma subunit
MDTDTGTESRQDLHARYLVAMDAMDEASDQAIDALRAGATARQIMREHLGAGGRVSDIDRLIEPEAVRAGVSRALSDLERARHHARRLLFQLLQSEGCTLTEIGRMWGISRQLVSRLVNEPAARSSP